ncbi:MAG: hypothetical protein M3P83_04965, partial [Actinomycetota bacterium]|nr:hypothetical protein [Actinomycetota bacterium]
MTGGALVVRVLGVVVLVVSTVLGASDPATAQSVAPTAASHPDPRGDHRAGAASRRARVPTAHRAVPPRPPPLRPVTMHAIAPRVLEPGTPVEVTGTVTNTGEEDWGDVQVGLVTSSVPFTTPADLEAAAVAAERDPRAYIGDRVVDPGTFDDIGTIPIGGRASFALRVPFSSLRISGAQGVYWLGVQVNANIVEGRATVAEERTFIPLLDRKGVPGQVRVALLWPLTGGVPKGAEGYRNDTLATEFAPGGRLQTITEMGASSTGVPVSWVLDPALLAAARDMANGYRLRPQQRVGPASVQAGLAARWRDLAVGALRDAELWALPYGDPDVASLVHARLTAPLSRARREGSRVLDRLDLDHRAMLWPAAGLGDAAMARAGLGVGSEAALLSRDSVVTSGEPSRLSLPVGRSTLPTLVQESTRLRARVSPTRDQTVLTWRQELLAVTALMALEGGPDNRTAVVAPAREWWPDERWHEAQFFSALNVPWIDAVPASDVLFGATPDRAVGESATRTAQLR